MLGMVDTDASWGFAGQKAFLKGQPPGLVRDAVSKNEVDSNRGRWSTLTSGLQIVWHVQVSASVHTCVQDTKKKQGRKTMKFINNFGIKNKHFWENP